MLSITGPILLLTVCATSAMVNGMDMEDFFPDLNQNLTKITWAHAVNNQSYLNHTLENGGINMIEADIVLGTLNGSGNLIPVMGHPPENVSDLSLESFLEQVKTFDAAATNTTRKGVKLDFKSFEVFNMSLKIVESFDKGDFPIWINADILPGPINATTLPVDASNFLQGARAFPNSTLSIGWTTQYGADYTGSYNSSQINDMIDVIRDNNVSQNITFPVRAGLAAESIDLLVNLTNQISNSTITIWSSEGDNVEVEHLRLLIKTIGLNKTFVDVPTDLLEQLHLDNLPNDGMKLRNTFWFTCLIGVILGFLNM